MIRHHNLDGLPILDSLYYSIHPSEKRIHLIKQIGLESFAECVESIWKLVWQMHTQDFWLSR